MKSIIAAAALVATTTASNLAARAYNFNTSTILDRPLAKVVNRCPYSVYLWSIGKQTGCPPGTGLELKTGQFYHENFQTTDTVGEGGVSIKLSKFETCVQGKLTQLEYKIETQDEQYAGNYLDMSFVDCTGDLEDCPGRADGFYLQSGNQNGLYESAVNNEHCPIFSVFNAEEAAAVSYINWNDRQTKFCDQKASLELYLCGGEAPGAEDSSPAPPSSSSEIASSSAQSSSSSSSPSEEAAPSTTEEAVFKVAAAAEVTSAPVAAPVVKTEVVYVTQYVKARHAHGRRHQQFHA